MENPKKLADSVSEFFKDRKDQLTTAERQALIKTIMTIEQFCLQDECKTTEHDLPVVSVV